MTDTERIQHRAALDEQARLDAAANAAHARRDEAIRARAYQLLVAAREKHFAEPLAERRPAVPGWNDLMADAARQLDAEAARTAPPNVVPMSGATKPQPSTK